MAPEVLKGCASPASDAWACGVMLYELLTGQFPFWREPASDVASLGARAVTEAINHGPVLFPRDPFGASSPAAQGGRGQGLRPSVQDLLLALLQRDPSRRLSARQAAEHPWFSEVLGE
jgi:serine/threonine protein kinase